VAAVQSIVASVMALQAAIENAAIASVILRSWASVANAASMRGLTGQADAI
jgi:hypothetical protein